VLQRNRDTLIQQHQVESDKDETALQLAQGALAKAQMARDENGAALREAVARVADCKADYDRSSRLVQDNVISEAELQKQRATLRMTEAERDRESGQLRIAEQEVVLQERLSCLKRQEAQIAAAERTRLEADLDSRLAAAEQEMRALALEEVKLRNALDNLDVKAPVNGIVTCLLNKTAGEVVRAGDVIATIVPDGVPWVVEAQISNRDAGALRQRIGGRVNLKIDAFPFRDYGICAGTLLEVSTDATEQQQLGMAYRIRVGMASLDLRRGWRAGKIELGMTATVEIVKEEERVLALLFRGIRDRVSTE
jgi:HlyD family type I secretion membrane fusion protein